MLPTCMIAALVKATAADNSKLAKQSWTLKLQFLCMRVVSSNFNENKKDNYGLELELLEVDSLEMPRLRTIPVGRILFYLLRLAT